MARIDRSKRALGGAIKRSTPSRAATILVERGLVIGRTLDYGCGYGLDAATFGWDAYDPYYRPAEPAGSYDTIVCTLVLNALSRNNRAKVLARIQALLAEDAMLIGDGGGHVQSFPKPMVGGRRIAQLFYATWLRCGSGVEMRPVVLNGQWAMLRFIDGQLEAAMSFETDGTRIGRILVQRNREKLSRIASACAAG